jgi:hydrogenase maturation protease
MNLPAVDRIVNALLYEGYILYPYRASSVKNRLRFNFGVVYPKAYAEAQSGNDACSMQTQCLVNGGDSLAVCVRFLRLIESGCDGWQEAIECRVDLLKCPLTSITRDFSEGEISGTVEVLAEPVRENVTRITVRIANTTNSSGTETRDAALAHSLISAHTILGIDGGEFISLLEPPDDLAHAAAECRNIGTWPVLVGERGDKTTLLSSPIVLYDYPAIAPESPGDLFDATEIDEILTLRVLTMTEQEKMEARATDPRARRILDRAESLNEDQLAALHGTFRTAGGSS